MTAVKRPTPSALLDAGEVRFEFFRSSGPGGQNVNKVSTAVRLRFDLKSSRFLPEGVKARLARSAGGRMTVDGVLIVEARRFRTRERNRQDALERLMVLIRKAWEKPRERRPTKPTVASVTRRRAEKRRRGEKKRGRRRAEGSND